MWGRVPHIFFVVITKDICNSDYFCLLCGDKMDTISCFFLFGDLLEYFR